METIFFVGCGLKEQYRIKNFLEGSYEVMANPSVNNSLEQLRDEPVHLLVYDTDNAIPLNFFLDQVSSGGPSAPPVAVLSGAKRMKDVQLMYDLGVVSVIPKPCNKKGLLRGIQEGLSRRDKARTVEAESEEPTAKGPAYSITKADTEVLIGLRKQALISRIRPQGLDFQLPASLNPGGRILFRNPEFFSLIRLRTNAAAHMELGVTSCSKLSEYRFEVAGEFLDASGGVMEEALKRYVDKNAGSRKAMPVSPRVLLAEGQSITRRFFQSFLEESGFTVVSTDDGTRALDLIKRDLVDVVVTELNLPNVGGRALIDAIQKRRKSIPIVMVTGESDPRVKRDLASRVDGFLSKPVTGETVTECVKDVLKGWADAPFMREEPSASKFVDVRLETNLLVAFREHVKLVHIARGGLTFLRAGPIAPGTLIFVKTDAIAIRGREAEAGSRSFEMRVSQSQPHQGYSTYMVHAEFIGAPS